MNTRAHAQRTAVQDVLVEADLAVQDALWTQTLDRVVKQVLDGTTPEKLADYLDRVEKLAVAGDPWTVKTAGKLIAAVRAVS